MTAPEASLREWFEKADPLAQSLAGLAAALALLALVFLVWRASRALRGKKAADALTVLAAAMASSVAATGMWHFFSRTMHLPTWIQAVLFAFMEISVLASALRARANVAREGQAGADGAAVWVLTSASGLMSASEAGSFQEALVRLGAPLVAAWLWERSMVPERRARKAAKGTPEAAVRWLFSVKRVAVRLGLATALGADLETEDANRRIDRFVRADNKAQRAGRLTRRRSARRRDRAHARLMEQARMQADPGALFTHLGRQAILDVLARLGGDDAVIDRERARQMRDILGRAVRDHADAPSSAHVKPAPGIDLSLLLRADGFDSGESADYLTPRQLEPVLAAATAAAASTSGNGTPVAAAPITPHANGSTPATAPSDLLAARPRIPVEPVQFIAAHLAQPAASPDPEPARDNPSAQAGSRQQVRPPTPAHRTGAETALADRITRAIAASPTRPNLLKLSNDLGISPTDMQDALDSLGGFESVWERSRHTR